MRPDQQELIASHLTAALVGQLKTLPKGVKPTEAAVVFYVEVLNAIKLRFPSGEVVWGSGIGNVPRDPSDDPTEVPYIEGKA